MDMIFQISSSFLLRISFRRLNLRMMLIVVHKNRNLFPTFFLQLVIAISYILFLILRLMGVYFHECMWMHLCIHIYIYPTIYIYIYIYIYICIYVCVCGVCVCVCSHSQRKGFLLPFFYVLPYIGKRSHVEFTLG